jgi:hypothetical protein
MPRHEQIVLCGGSYSTAGSEDIFYRSSLMHLLKAQTIDPGMRCENSGMVIKYTCAGDKAEQKSLDNQPPLLLF